MDPTERIAELEALVDRLRAERDELDDEMRVLSRAERRFFEVERNLEVQMSRMQRLNRYFIKSTRIVDRVESVQAAAKLLGGLFGLPVVGGMVFEADGLASGVCVVDRVSSRYSRQLTHAQAELVTGCPIHEPVLVDDQPCEADPLFALFDTVFPQSRYGPFSQGTQRLLLILRDADGQPTAFVGGMRSKRAGGVARMLGLKDDDAPFLQVVHGSVQASLDAVHMKERLSSAARELEDRVRERTMELTRVNGRLAENVDVLKATQSELIEASRLAGMSEVATGVLHNVGNVLNSVNVSASLVHERVHTLLDGRLDALAELLERASAHPETMPDADRLGLYVRKLSARLEAEKRTLRSETDQLTHNVDHIRNIVSTQQSFAKAAGVTEVCQIEGLINDALTLNREALAKRSIAVDVALPALPPVRVDRHKVLQILVNLLSNAIQAVQANPDGGRGIRVVATQRQGQVVIAVDDDGCGIEKENLARVFAQGFTTRPDGHGFGLHASACAAAELGGELVALSEGKGRGARFELVLPQDERLAA